MSDAWAPNTGPGSTSLGGFVPNQAPRLRSSGPIGPRVPTRDGGGGGLRETGLESRLGPRDPSNIVTVRYEPPPGDGLDTETYIRKFYPYLAAFMNHPEVGAIIRRAGQERWDEARLYGALSGTQWWRTTSAAARTWDALAAEDPAEASRLAGQTAATIQNRARTLGVQLGSGQIQQLALTATRNNWTDAQVVDQLLNSLNWSTLAAGDLTALRDTVKQIGGRYLVDVSDSTAQSYAAAIASGEMSEAGVASLMQRQAKARFSWMADEIDQGVTPEQYFMPVRDTIASELEMSPDSINMMDGRWLAMMEIPGEDGKPRAATLNEARMAARRQPEWERTSAAEDLITAATAGLGDVFGRRTI
jgi:hypothetical protein